MLIKRGIINGVMNVINCMNMVFSLIHINVKLKLVDVVNQLSYVKTD